jgi:hypothetical protein
VTKHRMTLLEELRKCCSTSDIDFLRQGVKTLAEPIIEMEGVC